MADPFHNYILSYHSMTSLSTAVLRFRGAISAELRVKANRIRCRHDQDDRDQRARELHFGRPALFSLFAKILDSESVQSARNLVPTVRGMYCSLASSYDIDGS